MKIKKSILTHISRVGVRTYVEREFTNLTIMKRNIKRWVKYEYIDTKNTLLNIVTNTRKKSQLSLLQIQKLMELCRQCREMDACVFMKECISFYIKRHKFTFDVQIHDHIRSELEHDYNTLYTIFTDTVSSIECSHGYFKRSLQKPKCKKQSTKIGPFNMYVKDQWKTREQELRSICMDKQSTEVMKVLSSEWKSKPDIRREYIKKSKECKSKPLQ